MSRSPKNADNHKLHESAPDNRQRMGSGAGVHDFAGAEIVDGYDGQQFDHPFYDLNFASSFARDPLFGGHDETLENNAAQTAPPHLPAAQPVHIWNTHGTHVQVGPGHHPGIRNYPTPATTISSGSDHCGSAVSSITNVSEETNYTGGPFVNEPMGGEMDIDRPSEIVIEQKDAVEKNWHYCGECGKKFSRQHDLHRHEKTKHATDCEIYLCGHCRKKEDTRKDKLLEHIRKTHGENTNDGTSAICILLGCKTGKFAGAMFANNVRLSEHENSGHIDRLKYANADRAINGQKRNSATLNKTIFSKSSKTSQPQTPAEGKRSGPAIGPAHKRQKAVKFHIDSDDTDASGKTESATSDGTPVLEEALKSLESHPEVVGPDSDVQEIHNVEPAEFLEISKRNDVKEADHMLVNGGLCQSDIALSAETQPKGKIVFILSARSIRLQGSPILVSHARKTLEDALRRLKRGIEGYAVQIHSLSRNYGHQFGRKFMNNQTTLGSKKLFPVSPPQDKMYIQTWRKHILPQLPDILTPLGDDYSASLVRYGVEETQTNVYIRIRSSNIYKNTQNSISKEVHKLWTSHSAEPIAMLFIKGVLSLIAGISDQCVQDEENQAEGNLPHHQRYQKYASMSSSLGLRCNGTVSGTLGGYVLVDNKMHILTTDHFIEDALREAGESSGGDNTKHQITSPSLFDIETLREDFRASIVSCGIGIAEELEKTHQNEFTPAQAEQADVDSSWWDLVRRWQNDLNQPEEHFVIGKVTDRRARPFIRIDCGGVIADRTMDWALCSVVPGRTGQNRHRHKEQPPYTPLVLEDEGRNPFGTGELCLETVQPGERTAIHYVGAGTGFQSGFVNPAETLVNKRGRKTNEFSITLTSSPQIAHNGDSGAWIIQTEGNKAVGMLWGEEVDLLHFTPLKDIFDNIREQLRVEVCLPGRPYHPPSEAYRKGISRTGQRQSKPRIFQPPARVPPWKGPLKKNLDPLVEAPNPNRSLTQKGPIPSISEASTGNSNSAWRLSREDPIPECLMPSAKTPNPGLLRPGRATGGKQNSAGGDGGSSRLPSLMSDMSISDSTSENPANPPLIGFPVEPLSSPCDTPKKCSIPFLIESFKVGEAENGALASSPQAYPQEVTMPDTNYGITLVANS